VEQLRADELLRGIEVVHGADATGALQQLQARPATVVVAAGDGSPSDSLARARAVHAAHPGTPVVLLASGIDRASLVECLRAGVFACLRAPCDAHDLAAIVAAAVQQPGAAGDIEVLSALPGWLTLRAASRRDVAERVLRFAADYWAEIADAERQDLLAAFREMLLNAMEHGAGFDSGKRVIVSTARMGRAVVFHVADPGSGFTSSALPHAAGRRGAPDAMAHLERRASLGLRPGGFGIMLARDLVDELAYNARGNEVVLVKYVDSNNSNDSTNPNRQSSIVNRQ
jgi:anti-sigma regulatory factor (Ser/Thr protein kinase)